MNTVSGSTILWRLLREYKPIVVLHWQYKGLLAYQSVQKSYSQKGLHKLMLPETVFISFFYEVEMNIMYPKVIYLVILDNFTPPQTHAKALYTTNEVHLRAHILPKVLISQFDQKLYSCLSFMKWKCAKCTQSSYFWRFLKTHTNTLYNTN